VHPSPANVRYDFVPLAPPDSLREISVRSQWTTLPFMTVLSSVDHFLSLYRLPVVPPLRPVQPKTCCQKALANSPAQFRPPLVCVYCGEFPPRYYFFQSGPYLRTLVSYSSNFVLLFYTPAPTRPSLFFSPSTWPNFFCILGYRLHWPSAALGDSLFRRLGATARIRFSVPQATFANSTHPFLTRLFTPHRLLVCKAQCGQLPGLS